MVAQGNCRIFRVETGYSQQAASTSTQAFSASTVPDPVNSGTVQSIRCPSKTTVRSLMPRAFQPERPNFLQGYTKANLHKFSSPQSFMIRNRSTPWIYRHFRPLMGAIASVGASTTAYLTVSKLLNQTVACPIKGCEQVLNSAYATVLGVPLSLWGFLAYSTIAVLALAPLLANSFKNRQLRNDLEQWTALFMLIGTTAMTTFSGYLMYLLAFQIHALCLYCIVSALLSLSLFILAVTGRDWSDRGQLVLTGIVVVIVTLVGTLWLYSPINANSSSQLNQPVSVSILSDLKQASQKGLTSDITAAKTLLRAIPGALPPSQPPAVLYIGADYCPYCATLRWSLALALLRFGELDDLHYMRSSSSDVYPDTPTFSFYKSNYQSRYLTFSSVELQDREGKSLQRPTAKQQSLVEKFDNAPYTDNPGSIPFVYVGGRYIQSGAPVSPSLLHGLSWSQITQQLQKPNSPIAQSILSDANLLTAAFCQVSEQAPRNACEAPGVKAATANLPR